MTIIYNYLMCAPQYKEQLCIVDTFCFFRLNFITIDPLYRRHLPIRESGHHFLLTKVAINLCQWTLPSHHFKHSSAEPMTTVELRPSFSTQWQSFKRSHISLCQQ